MEKGQCQTFNYPVINFTDKTEFPSMWGVLYNDIYNNEKMSPKKMMQKYKQFQDFELELNDSLSKGKKLPRQIDTVRPRVRQETQKSITLITKLTRKK